MWTRSDHNIKNPVASVRLVVTPLLHLYEDGDGAYIELHLLLPFTRIQFNNPWLQLDATFFNPWLL